MNNIRIQNLPLMSPVDSMKIPTGGSGSYSINLSSLKEFIRLDLFKPVLEDYLELPTPEKVKDQIIVSSNELIFSDGDNFYNIQITEISPPVQIGTRIMSDSFDPPQALVLDGSWQLNGTQQLNGIKND